MGNIKDLGDKFEKAVRLLSQKMPPSKTIGKPALFHGIRVGTYLYLGGYPEDIVLAGVLHDTIEETDLTEKKLAKRFGKHVATLVKANTKDKSIKDSGERIRELIKRCANVGKEALIVKAADIIDNFNYFSREKSKKGLDYCVDNAKEVVRHWPKGYRDKTFTRLKDELKHYR